MLELLGLISFQKTPESVREPSIDSKKTSMPARSSQYQIFTSGPGDHGHWKASDSNCKSSSDPAPQFCFKGRERRNEKVREK